jgi:hypothetical protein
MKPKTQRLYNGPKSGTPKVKGTGYATRKKAQNTLKKIKRKSRTLRKQILTTLYYRAKYHKHQRFNEYRSVSEDARETLWLDDRAEGSNKHQTKGMRNAMKVFQKYGSGLSKPNLKKQKGGSLIPLTKEDWIYRTKPAYLDIWETRDFPLPADTL